MRWIVAAVMGLGVVWPVPAQQASTPVAGASSPAGAFGAARPRAWAQVPIVSGHLTSRDIGVVINTADAYSVQVGEFYIAARGLKPDQVLRVELPLKTTLGDAEFEALAARIKDHFGPAIQALALAWRQPYAVNCNSITGALALGLDNGLCSQSCSPSRRSTYFNSASSRPFTDLKMRPSMLLAARDVDEAKAMIERGVAADHTLGLRGAIPVRAYFVTTSDKARSSRAVLFPPAGLVGRLGIDVLTPVAESIDNAERVLVYQTGLARVPQVDAVKWVPGALADHLTSFGGQLDGNSGQMSALEWISAGATASYGTVSEPCSHPQKFPHPQVLLQHYAQGETAIEAYWKSVAWPQQGLFIGEPLASPFSRR